MPAIIGNFAIDLDLRLGGGTVLPADGMSINYARAEDPIFVLAGKNGDNYGFACTPAGECGGYEAEEGTTTGLSVALDEWQSGAVSQGDVIGITIRVDGNIIANYAYPHLNGDSTDLTSLQTYDGYMNGSNPGIGQFVPLHAEVTKDGHVIVRYKLNPDGTQHEVTPAGGLATTFAASPASLVIGGRTGGANSNDHVDNIHIVTAVSLRPIWGPIINISPSQITWQIFDSPTVTFDPTSALAITLDGNPVTPDAGSVVKNGATTSGTLSFPSSNPLASGSTHTLAGAWTSSDGGKDSGSHNFLVRPYTQVPASYATGTHVDPTTDTPGFKVRIHQLPVPPWGYPGCDPNGNREMENQLADYFLDPTTGLPYDNQADLTTVPPDEAPDVYFADVINYGGGADGHFPTDNKIPGIPSLNPIVHASSDWDAMDIEAFLQLKAGCYRF